MHKAQYDKIIILNVNGKTFILPTYPQYNFNTKDTNFRGALVNTSKLMRLTKLENIPMEKEFMLKDLKNIYF